MVQVVPSQQWLTITEVFASNPHVYINGGHLERLHPCTYMDNAPETLRGIQRKDCLLSLPNYIDTCLIIRFSITLLRTPPIVGVQGKTVLVGHFVPHS